jgi:hypothetical protein
MDDDRHRWKYQLAGIIIGVALAFVLELVLSQFTVEWVEVRKISQGSAITAKTKMKQSFGGLPGTAMLGAFLGWLLGGFVWAIRLWTHLRHPSRAAH